MSTSNPRARAGGVELGAAQRERPSDARHQPGHRRAARRADQATVPGPHVAGEARQQMTGARVAPLTEAQLGDVIGQRNQLRVVLGSTATGADLLRDLLEQARTNPMPLT